MKRQQFSLRQTRRLITRGNPDKHITSGALQLSRCLSEELILSLGYRASRTRKRRITAKDIKNSLGMDILDRLRKVADEFDSRRYRQYVERDITPIKISHKEKSIPVAFVKRSTS